jgi:HK97 family phage portal protein
VQILTREGGYETRSANPLAPWGSTAPPPPGSVGGSFGGVQVNEHTALQQVTVYGSVGLISEQIATLPIKQWKLVNGEPKQIDPSPVIAQPWAEIDQCDFITQGTMSLLLRGNLWGRKIGMDANGCPEQVQLVHPDHARVRRNPSSGAIEVHYWNAPVPDDQVTRKMALSVPDGLQGLSPIEYLRNTIGLARAQDLASGAFFANSARPDGVIQLEGDLDDDETQKMMAAWLAAHQGINRMGLPAILTGGATWKPITMSAKDAQFLEQMQFSASLISGMIYRCPPHMLGMVDKDTSWGAGIEQQELGFVRNTLLIWLKRWEDLMRSWLPPRQFVTFDLSQRLRGDTLQRWSAYQIARVIGAMNNAEVRKEEGLPMPTDAAQIATLEDFAAPLNSAPVKAASSSTVGPGGDKGN